MLVASDVASTGYIDHGWEALPIGQYKYGVSADGGATIAWSECLDKDYMALSEATDAEVKVYPNPATDQVTVEGEGLQRITLTNLMGQVFYDNVISNDIIILPLEKYKNGVYFMNIISNNTTITKKIQILR